MICTRYRNALARLIEKIGHEWLGDHPPPSTTDLYHMRETVIDLIARQRLGVASGTGRPSAPSNSQAGALRIP